MKVLSSPSQTIPPFSNVGVTVIVATTGSVVILVAVKAISPVPERPAPI